MIAVHVPAVLVGTILSFAVLISALETVVLPRSSSTRITRFVFAVADRILVHRSTSSAWAENLRALYGPIALVSLPLVWMLSVAGTPPSPVAMLANMQRSQSLDNVDLWRTMMNWLIDLEQTHTSFPALCYFPQSSPDQSWVASVGAMVDGAAIVLSASHFTVDPSDLDEVKGPMLALAYGMPGLVRIARAAGLPLGEPVLLAELMSKWTGPLPEISITRAEYVAALELLTSVVTVPDGDVESCWQRFAWLRSSYDQAVRGLAGLTWAGPAEWSTDRPARVGRPRLLLQRSIAVDWTVPPASPPVS